MRALAGRTRGCSEKELHPLARRGSLHAGGAELTGLGFFSSRRPHSLFIYKPVVKLYLPYTEFVTFNIFKNVTETLCEDIA